MVLVVIRECCNSELEARAWLHNGYRKLNQSFVFSQGCCFLLQSACGVSSGLKCRAESDLHLSTFSSNIIIHHDFIQRSHAPNYKNCSNSWIEFLFPFSLNSSPAKPISLVERCWCRSTVNTVPQRSIRELKFLHTPNCPFQVMWVSSLNSLFPTRSAALHDPETHHFTPSISKYWRDAEWARNWPPLSGIIPLDRLSQLHTSRGKCYRRG